MLSSLSSRAPDGEQDECREIQAEVGRQMDVQVTGLDQDVARGGGPIAQEIEDKIEEQAESAEEDIEEAMKGYEEAIRIVKDKARRAIKEGSEEDVIKETQENIQMIEDEFMMQARAKIKESKPKEKPGEKEADVPEQAFPASRTLPNQNMGEVGETCAGLDYEMHYETSQHSVKDVVREILQDIATNKNLHDWDDKLVITPFKKLETVIRRYLATCSQEMLNDLLIHSSVDEVRSENGQLQNTPALLEEGQATGQFFFPKDNAISRQKDAMSYSQGRVICVKECKSHDERAVLLWVHALCIRLRDEDKAYLRNFIERHLSLRAAMSTPYHWQPASPPELSRAKHQKHYRRVSMSFHLTYLTMSAGHSHAERQSVLDQSPLLSMHIGRQDKNLENQYLYKTSFSTLLTIVIPEESRNREEEIDLLKSPQGLWTVLMINYPQLDSHKELDTHLTPVSQFIRGMTAAIITQRHNAESIVDFLRLELQSCDSAGLFDDKNFTKSNTYHRTIQACNELKDSLDSTARFMAKLIAGQLKELRSVVHRDEKPGVEHWSRRMQEELFSLKEITAQVEGLNRRAQESRAALHGATAVLESRTALEQGQQLKILAYLATLYLPLTATASIYSMSVLPSSATFASCFIVFALLVFLTLLTSFYPTILHQVKSIDLEALKGKLNGSLNTANAIAPEKLMDPSRVTSPLQKEDSKATKSRWIRYLLELRPRSESNPRNLFSAWVHGGILAIVFDFLVPELQFPRHQYNLYKNRHNKFLIASGWRWHPLAFVRDIVRLLLLPVWAALAIALLISWAVYKVIWCLTLCFVGCFTCFR